MVFGSSTIIAFGLALLATRAMAGTDPVPVKSVCDPTSATVIKASLLQKLMDQHDVSYNMTGKPDLMASDVIAAYSNPVELKQLKNKNSGLEEVELIVQNMIQKSYPSYSTENPAVTAKDYIKSNSSIVINCKLPNPSGQPTQAATKPSSITADDPKNPLNFIRVRGTPDDLIFNESDVRYNAASKTSVSFSDNGTSKTRTDQLQSAIGAAFDFGSPFVTIVPYVAGARNVSFMPSKPEKVSTNTADVGIAANYETPAIIPPILGSRGGFFDLSFRPDYLRDFNTGARLLTGNLLVSPYIAGLVNDHGSVVAMWCAMNGITEEQCAQYTDWAQISALVDMRTDLGMYEARGNTMPQINDSYARIGTRFGFDITNETWYDLTITHTYLYGITGYYPNINDFMAQLTLSMPGALKNFGITTSYQNGRAELTAARTQMWSVALTAKF